MAQVFIENPTVGVTSRERFDVRLFLLCMIPVSIDWRLGPQQLRRSPKLRDLESQAAAPFGGSRSRMVKRQLFAHVAPALIATVLDFWARLPYEAVLLRRRRRRRP